MTEILEIIKDICEEKGIPENAVMKITGSAGGGNQKKIEDLIKEENVNLEETQ